MPNLPNFPIPSETPEDTRCIRIQIPNNDDWMQVFVGLLAQPTYWFNWQRDEGRNGTLMAQHWTKLFDQIDWSDMSCCCDEAPVQYRYTSDGVLQRSTDGGTTWEDAPTYDPRNYSPQFPPMTGPDDADKKCLAATGAVALLKEQVGNQLTDDMSRYTLSQLIKDWVGTMIESSNPFQALVTVTVNQIFALVIATLRPALTDDVYDTLKCILYCRMATDASFNDAQWALVRSDTTSKISGIAGVFLEHLVYLLGTVGLTNLARASGASEGDCSACGDCAVHVYVDNQTTGVWELVLPDDGTDNQYTIPAQMNPSSGVYAVYQLFQVAVTPPPDLITAHFLSLTSSGGGIVNRGTVNPDGSSTAGHWPSPDECPSGIYAESNVPFNIIFTVSTC
jgi:hypothetical protein